MKIINVKPVGKKEVYDISVKDVEHYVLENGVVTHNTGVMLSSDNVWIFGRQQEKEGTEVVGYNVVINIEKSRHVREKSKFTLTLKHEGGLNKWSGLMDIALESGHVLKPKVGWYCRVIDGIKEEKNYRLKDTNSSLFWLDILNETSFKNYIRQTYQVSHGKLIQDEPDADDTSFEYDED